MRPPYDVVQALIPPPLKVVPLQPLACGRTLWRAAGALRATVFVKATFAMADGRDAWPIKPQDLVREDRHREGDPGRSLVEAMETAPFLSSAGVLVEGHAYAPPGQTATAVMARLSVFRDVRLLEKTVYVYGDRASGTASPQPFRQMPLVYERAYGGPGFPDNPVGVGLPGTAGLPNLVDPADPRRPAGFGPLSPRWGQRTRLLGPSVGPALDAPIVEIPEDLDWRALSAAPSDQQLPYFRGDEWLVLDGMTPSTPRLSCRLPSVQVQGRLYLISSRGVSEGSRVSFNADTLVIQADQQLCSLVWRAQLPADALAVGSAIRVFVGMELPGRPVSWPDPEDLVVTADERSSVGIQVPAAVLGSAGIALGGPPVLGGPPAGAAVPARVGAPAGVAAPAVVSSPAGQGGVEASRSPWAGIENEATVEGFDLPEGGGGSVAGAPGFAGPPFLGAPSVALRPAAGERGSDPNITASAPMVPAPDSSRNRLGTLPAEAFARAALPFLQRGDMPLDTTVAGARPAAAAAVLPFATAEASRAEGSSSAPPMPALGRRSVLPFGAMPPPAAPTGGPPVRLTPAVGMPAVRPPEGGEAMDLSVTAPARPSPLRDALPFMRPEAVREQGGAPGLGGAGAPGRPAPVGGFTPGQAQGAAPGVGGVRPELVPAHLGETVASSVGRSTAAADAVGGPRRSTLPFIKADEVRAAMEAAKRPEGGQPPEPARPSAVMAPPALVTSPGAVMPPPVVVPPGAVMPPPVVVPPGAVMPPPVVVPPGAVVPSDATQRPGMVLPPEGGNPSEPVEAVLQAPRLGQGSSLQQLRLGGGAGELGSAGASSSAALQEEAYRPPSASVAPVSSVDAAAHAGEGGGGPGASEDGGARHEGAAHEGLAGGALAQEIGPAEGGAVALGVTAAPAGSAVPAASVEVAPSVRGTDLRESPLRLEILERLRTGRSIHDLALADADLEGIDFRGVVLSRCNFKGARLLRCGFAGARLSEAQLAGADLTEADLTGADLTGADLSRAVLARARLDEARLVDANLGGARGPGASFAGASAARATFARGVWESASFKRMDAPSADFGGATLDGASFEEATLTEVSLEDARGVETRFERAQMPDARAQGMVLEKGSLEGVVAPRSHWDGATLRGCSLAGADLEGAVLQRVICVESGFAGANLRKANLQRLNGDHAELRDANLEGADLRQARLREAGFEGAKLGGVVAGKADLAGSRFSRADLTNAVLRAAKLKAAVFSQCVLEGVDMRDADLEGADMRGASRKTAKLNGANLRGLVEDAATPEGSG
ncbi:DUF2169 family type VI secretion system accessory protein [Chondromyces crocatus]|uniref:DUF2169 family type VI secretion system accessory protein n=1 Tax=Chondromyces crocatus TaxID=52 RepID=UPI00067E20C8|nr:DUF2169 domain-containing protein [Chondromyces crocatus]